MSAKQKIVSLLAALALVVSLCAVVAVPAGATITQPQVTLSNDTAGAGAVYTIKFTTTSNLAAGDQIVITFPTGTGNLGAIGTAQVTVNGTAATNVTNPLGTVLVVTVPAAIAKGSLVTVVVGAGATLVTNPATVGSKTLKVHTTQETTDVESASYTIKGISFDPTSGTAGTTVTVTGVGFTPNTSVDIFLDTDGDNTVDVGETVLASTTVGADGSFTATFTAVSAIKKPPINGVIDATDGASRNYNATFTVEPVLTIEPSEGTVGTAVKVSGADFTARATATDILVYWQGTGGTKIATLPGALAAGSTTFTVSNAFNVPMATAGPKMVTVVADTTPDGVFTPGEETASAYFDVAGRTLTLNPSSGPVGTAVTVSGTGFLGGENITLTFATLTKTVTADSNGSFTTGFVVPMGATTGPVTATGVTSGAVAQATFTIPAASLSIDPTEGSAGTEVTLTATGLTPSATYTVTWTDPAPGAAPVTVAWATTDTLGAFTTTIKIPVSSIGNGTINVLDSTGVAVLTKTFTVKAVAVTPTVTDALKSIEGKYLKVWGFDAATQSWKLYDPAAPEASDLASLEKGKGYWIQVSEDCTLIYGGNTYELKAGWNLIGWLG